MRSISAATVQKMAIFENLRDAGVIAWLYFEKTMHLEYSQPMVLHVTAGPITKGCSIKSFKLLRNKYHVHKEYSFINWFSFYVHEHGRNKPRQYLADATVQPLIFRLF